MSSIQILIHDLKSEIKTRISKTKKKESKRILMTVLKEVEYTNKTYNKYVMRERKTFNKSKNKDQLDLRKAFDLEIEESGKGVTLLKEKYKNAPIGDLKELLIEHCMSDPISFSKYQAHSMYGYLDNFNK